MTVEKSSAGARARKVPLYPWVLLVLGSCISGPLACVPSLFGLGGTSNRRIEMIGSLMTFNSLVVLGLLSWALARWPLREGSGRAVALGLAFVTWFFWMFWTAFAGGVK
jgi:hypothetical protein